jgi:hypothetical protein
MIEDFLFLMEIIFYENELQEFLINEFYLAKYFNPF